ncbi:hypothetical protein QR680_017575 [Steinernema hermaphroditum]|uniref:F-box domain-containing protein n=1 Tax=Steinernema hermaphroditum TaxID=289476 RepID=A0AA39HF36_9BILA|nr:hypothetical protein QR680_017575 [Steinernema hermaphroditum]
MTVAVDRFQRQSRFATRIANVLTIDEEFEAPSTSRNLVEGLPLEVWHRICAFLSVREFFFLELTSRSLRRIIEDVWRNREVVVLERDFEALRDLEGFQVPESTMNRFSLTADNLWTHQRKELDVLLPKKLILAAYNDLRFIVHKSRSVEQLVFLQKPYKAQRVPIGRSFFLFFSFDILERLHTLDLTMTSFDLYDLLDCAGSFPQLAELVAEGACIFMPRREILGGHAGKELRHSLVDYGKMKKAMVAGTKVFLAAAVETFPLLTSIRVGGAEYRSSGCITYAYGTENDGAEYCFVPQIRKRSYCTLLLKKAVAQFNNQRHFQGRTSV